MEVTVRRRAAFEAALGMSLQVLRDRDNNDELVVQSMAHALMDHILAKT